MILSIFTLLAVEIISIDTTKMDIFAATPSNQAVVAGKPMRLECGVINNSITLWYYQALGTKANSVLLYNGEAITTKIFVGDFTIDTAKAERQDLATNKVKLEHAGVYECVVLVSSSSSAIDQIYSVKAQVIVLESDPLCNSNLSNPGNNATEFDTVLIRCDLNYAGGWFPTMEWFKQISSRSLALESVRSQFSSPQSVSSFVITQVKSNDNGALFTYKTFFNASDNQVTTNASNSPDYVYQWNITINVEYGPRNITITPLLDSYERGSRLICETDANPSPVYRWTDMETSSIVNGFEIIIMKKANGHDVEYVYECYAENLVKGRRLSTSRRVVVKIKGNAWSLIRGYIFGLVGVFAGITISGIVFAVRLRTQKLSQGGSQQQKTITGTNVDLFNGEFVHQPRGEYEMMMRQSAVVESPQNPEHEETSTYEVIETYLETDETYSYYNVLPNPP